MRSGGRSVGTGPAAAANTYQGALDNIELGRARNVNNPQATIKLVFAEMVLKRRRLNKIKRALKRRLKPETRSRLTQEAAQLTGDLTALSELMFDLTGGQGGMKDEQISVRNGINEVTRLEYVKDCNVGVTRWNMAIKRAGVPFELKLPSTRFRRQVGVWAGIPTNPEGRPVTQAEFDARKDEWLPTEADVAFVKSLMQRVTEPGKMAAWIAPPDRGINVNPVDYEYVKL